MPIDFSKIRKNLELTDTTAPDSSMKNESKVFSFLEYKILDDSLTEYTGYISKIIFQSPKGDYMVAIFNPKDYDETMKITCQYVTNTESDITIFGEWEESEKWGKQFNSTKFAMDLDLSKNGLLKFLIKSSNIVGIGEAKAKKIVNNYGDNFEKFMETETYILSQELSINEDIIDNLKHVWITHKSTNQIAVNLSEFPLSQNHIMELVRLYGPAAIEKIRENPYFLITVLPSFGFKRADEIAMQNGIDPNSSIRKQACLDYLLMSTENSGNCWIDYDFLIDKMKKELSDVSYESIRYFLDDQYDTDTVKKFEDDGIIKLSSVNIFDKEKYIINYIIENSDYVEEFDYFKGGVSAEDLESLNEDQKKAVTNSMNYTFSVITGKAGTGKTFVISKIVEIFRRIGMEVACAAPTGKAARRMEEVTCYPASTIHRLLKSNGEFFEYNETNKMEDYDVIIIDEFSMVSIPLGYHLFAALPKNTKVIIVGDHNQLTAIGAGNIFNDILEYNKKSNEKVKFRVSELSKVVRQAGDLKKNSVAILDGQISHVNTDDWRTSFTDQFEDDYKLSSFVVDLMINSDKYTGYPLKDVQLIIPMKKETLELSTFKMNKLLQKAIQYKKYGNLIEITKYQDILYKHDKVMQIKNDYEIEVMNGTIGNVSYISSDGNITIDFEGGVSITYSKGDVRLNNVVLAYAMTTHKTQGSEYPCVVFVMHNSHYNMLNRNLLYTAVTRAKEKVMIFGDRRSIAIALSRDDTSDKKTNFDYHMIQY